MAGTFEIKTTDAGKLMFILKAGNGQVILTSQLYEAMDGVTNGIDSVRTNSQVEENFDRKVASDSSPYFSLVAGNGQIIGKSEMYSSEDGRDNGIASVKTNAPDAAVIDNSEA